MPIGIVAHDGPEIAEDIFTRLKAHDMTVVYSHLNITPDFLKKRKKQVQILLLQQEWMKEGLFHIII